MHSPRFAYDALSRPGSPLKVLTCSLFSGVAEAADVILFRRSRALLGSVAWVPEARGRRDGPRVAEIRLRGPKKLPRRPKSAPRILRWLQYGPRGPQEDSQDGGIIDSHSVFIVFLDPRLFELATL